MSYTVTGEYISLGANPFFRGDNWSPHVDQVSAGPSASSIVVCLVQSPVDKICLYARNNNQINVIFLLI